MPIHSVEDQIRQRVDQFVDELSDLIRQAAFEAVNQALGGTLAAPPARRGPGAARKKKRGRRAGRPAADVSDRAAAVLAHVRANPGQRLEEISREMGVASPALRPAVQSLLADGQLRTEGRARGTRYHAGGGGGGGARKRAGKKKRSARRKKAGRKKAGRRKKTSRRN